MNRSALAAAAAVLTAAAGTLASASSPPSATAALNVAPLRVEFARAQQTSQLLVRNDAARRLAVQIRLFAWSQDAGGEHYQPSSDFIISPSIVRIDPGLTQTIHIIAKAQPLAGREIAYRVVIDQLPESVEPVQGAAQTRLRLTLPLFAGTREAPPGAVQFGISGKALVISNTGGRSVQIAGVNLHQNAQIAALPRDTGPHYVLAGATLQFALPAGIVCGPGAVRVSGEIDLKPFDAAAQQSCP